MNDREAKRLYCQAIGLTEGYITSATPALLSRACTNLGLSTATMQAVQMRQWLTDFLTNAAMPPSGAPAQRQATVTINL